MNRFYKPYQRWISLFLVFVMLADQLPHALWEFWFSPFASHAAPAALSSPALTTGEPFAPETLLSGERAQTAPDVLANPLSLARVQSSYLATPVDGRLTITYTVTNNRPPTRFLDIPPGASITETIDLTSAFDTTRDPNTLRNVLLTTDLVTVAGYDKATPVPDRNGATLAWNLGDIAPMTRKTVVLTVDAPTSVTEFTALDSGATVRGILQGRAVSASTAPATLAPADFSQWLIRTVDADRYDEVMLAKAGELGQEPAALFAFVRGLDYESYDGSLRGTRGTLWSGAGNSVDQASLLIAMLRSAGIPVRYRHGTLAPADAQTLIGSMFPAPTRYAGHVPGSAEISDPLNDPDLLAETTDHWWVEAYLPGQGWRDMDPSFATAKIGDSFATPAADGSDRIAELPAAERHRIEFRLKVEAYHPLSAGSGGLTLRYPFTLSLNTVELAAQPVSFSHLVATEGEPGLAFSNVIHTYTPYLLVGDREILGDPYQELFTTFPLGTQLLTGAWLELDLIAPGGGTHSYERVVKDRIGFEARFNGGNADISIPSDQSALYTDFDILSIGFWPNFVPEEARERAQAEALAGVPAVNADSRRLMELRGRESLTPSEEDELRGIRARYQVNMGRYLSNLALSFAEAADRLAREVGAGGFVRSYYDTPRLIIAGSELLDNQTGTFSLDLRRTTVRAIAYPGQEARATVGFNIARGVIESGLEGAVLERSLGAPATTTARLFEAAQAQGIFPVVVDATNLYTLERLTISDQGKARITAAAQEGKLIHVPHAQVLLDGEYRTGWWEIDPLTGETIGVMDNGLHLAFLEYLASLALIILSGPLVDFMLGYTAYTWGFVANHVDKAIGPDTFDQDNYDWWMSTYSTTLTCISAIALPTAYSQASCAGGVSGGVTGVTMDFFGAGQKAAQGYLTSLVQGDPPLPDTWLTHRPADPPRSEISGVISDEADFPSGPLSASLDTPFIVYTGTVQAEWAGAGSNVYPFTTLTLPNGDLYDANGALIGSGPLAAVPTGEEPAIAAGARSAAVEGTGRAAYYAPAVSGLGSSTLWTGYTAELSGDDSLALSGAVVTLNGTDYSGEFTIESNEPATLDGSGAGAAPLFAPATTIENSGARLILGPSTGSATAGGVPVNVANGIALAGFDQEMNISESGSDTDHVDLEDTVDFFTLNLTPASSVTNPQSAISFRADIAANVTGMYTLTVNAPEGWHLSLSDDGEVTALPLPGAAAGEYSILLTAQAVAYPELYLSAIHTVTISDHDGLLLDLRPDPLFTVPMGPVRNPQTLLPRDTNTGQAQVPGAAYTINITNTANAERTIDLSVSGLPDGWTLLSSEGSATESSLTLPPGGVGQMGLYVNPGELPAPGSSYDFMVSAVSDSGLTAQDSGTFTMPPVPFSMLLTDPVLVHASPNSTATFDLTLTNVGNAAGTFPLSPRTVVDVVTPTAALRSPITLAPDESDTQSVTLTVGDAPPGQTFPIYFDSPVAGTVYTQTTALFVRIVSPVAAGIFSAADGVAACTDDGASLSAALEALALAAAELDASCESGECDLDARDDAIAAAESTAAYASLFSPLVTADDTLLEIAEDMETHSTASTLRADILALSDAAGTLGTEVCEIAARMPDARWAPVISAALSGQTATYTLSVENTGSVATSYAITVSLPGGPTTFNEMIDPGATFTRDFTLSPVAPGYYDLHAEVSAMDTEAGVRVRDEATARLNVVERFVQLTRVFADPPFVETGASTTELAIEAANVANVPREATAHAEIIAPGGAIRFSDDVPLTLLAGPPTTYNLGAVDSSGWAEGVYTISVELRDDAGAPLPDGIGHGYLNVGQALDVTHAVVPDDVVPGDATVTTVITTQILADTILPRPPASQAHGWEPSGLRQVHEDAPDEATILPDDAVAPAPATTRPASEPIPPERALRAASPITRTEDSVAGAVTYTGAWTSHSNASSRRASNGDFSRSESVGAEATFTFNGSWLAIGFATDRESGKAEILIDGVSRGVLDLYSRFEDLRQVTYTLEPGAHTATVRVLGERNPLASDEDVNLDYFDTWDGSLMADGVFEQDDPRVWLSNGWSNVTLAGASGGSYARSSGAAGMWFPFTGDSVSLQVVRNDRGGLMSVHIDGEFRRLVELYSLEQVTDTLSFTGLGAGEPHVLQLFTFREPAQVDAFIVPAAGPETPPTTGAYHRYEESDDAFLYNGLPITGTAQTWNLNATRTIVDGNYTPASNGYAAYSAAAGDEITLSFTGEWVMVGLLGTSRGGEAEIFIDGVSQGTVDTYRRENENITLVYPDPGAGAHTLTIRVLGTAHPYSGNSRVYLDFVDVWDGTSLPQGLFEETSERLHASTTFSLNSSAIASGGGYLRDGLVNIGTVWFPFMGNRVTLHALADRDAYLTPLYVDGEPVGAPNLINNGLAPRSISIGGFGPGLHVLEIRRDRGELYVDAVESPGSGPLFTEPTFTGITRYEENDPALRYDGESWEQRPSAWSETISGHNSGGYVASSSSAGSTVSLDFTGAWVNVGFRTRSSGGTAEVWVDGALRESVSLASARDTVTSTQISLITGTHTVSVTVASGNVWLDYIDVWDGTALSDEIVNASVLTDTGRIHVSDSLLDFTHPNALGGTHVAGTLFNVNGNIWYSFTGSSFTYYYVSRQNGGAVNLYLDDHFLDTVEFEYPLTEQVFARSYTGFEEGAHTVRVENVSSIRVDAFQSDRGTTTPYQPFAEWFDNAPRGGSGAFGTPTGPVSGLVAGDVTGDGNVEIVVAADDLTNWGTLFLYRGDGADTGDGDPIIWSLNLGNGTNLPRTYLGSPAIAELDGEPGAEIVLPSNRAMTVYHGDGTVYWITDTLKAHEHDGTPAIGNLDLDPEAEIVVNLDKTLAVFEHDGTLAWSQDFPEHVSIPLLADMTGDGSMDIVVSDVTDQLYLYDYNRGSPTLEWTTTLSSTIGIVRGAPAIADVDGQQPGGDPGPEIAITSEGRHSVIDADGSILWSTELDPGDPGGVSIADVDGDGEIEIVTGIKYDNGSGEGRLYVLNADGSILWHAPAYDSSSANSQSVLDVNGDGVYEIAWNGLEQGFTIYNGVDGTVLFNEPLLNSLTVTDYPIFADVDRDGYAEIVVPANRGIGVVGFDGVWGEARQLWNQHSYHITNINDDLSVPFNELPSWEMHNTYRTQYPDDVVLPIHEVTVTHTVAMTGVEVLTGTFNVPPDLTAGPSYRWGYTQDVAAPVITRTFDSLLPAMKPGETRRVAEGTLVRYTLPSGANELLLPPLYATAPHIIEASPLSQTVGAGATATYLLTLSNPAASEDEYTLSVAGLSEDWVSLPERVTLPAGGEVDVPLLVALPASAAPQLWTLSVLVTNSTGGQDQTSVLLTVVEALDLALSPGQALVAPGGSAPYDLLLSNREGVERTYDLDVTAPAGVTLPGSATVEANSTLTVPVTVTGDSAGPIPFTVSATAQETGASDRASAILYVAGTYEVALALEPPAQVGGPGATTGYTLTLSNLGTLSDSYDLEVQAPAGWSYRLVANDNDVRTISLPPGPFNETRLTLLVMPSPDAAPGNYDVVVTARSVGEEASDTVTGTLEVLNRGIDVAIRGGPTTLDPRESGTWQVEVTNTGTVADSYSLTATGIVAGSATFSENPVTLPPGASRTVEMTADGLDFALPQSYPLGVAAVSGGDNRIRDEDRTDLRFTGYEAVEVAWSPEEQVITGTTDASYSFTISNTGNLGSEFTFTFEGAGLTVEPEITSLYIPARLAATILVQVEAGSPGTYPIEGTATGAGGTASDTTTALLVVQGGATPTPTVTPTATAPPSTTTTPTATAPPSTTATPTATMPAEEPSRLYLPLISKAGGAPRLYLPLITGGQ